MRKNTNETTLSEVLGVIWIASAIIVIIIAFSIGPATGLRTFVRTSDLTSQRTTEMNGANSIQIIAGLYFAIIACIARIGKETEKNAKYKTPKERNRKFFIITGLILATTVIFTVIVKTEAGYSYMGKPQITADLKKTEADGIIYYTDIAPIDTYGDYLTIKGSLDPVTRINIEKLDAKVRIDDIKKSDVNHFYSTQSNDYFKPFDPATQNDKSGYSNSIYTFKDISLTEKTFRGVNIKSIKFTAFQNLIKDENEIDIEVETAYLPIQTGLVRVTIVRNDGSTELDKTFEHICNTIY